MLLLEAGTLLVISSLVKGDEASRIGNLSTGINVTPRLLSTSTVAPGLGIYILAALGGTGSAQRSENRTTTNSTTPTSSAPQTYCYTYTNKCFTDIYYTDPMIATTGSGSSYATACSDALSSYSSASSSWGSRHSSVINTTYSDTGLTYVPVTYYANATTLCDGHARVTYSPAVALSTTTITSRYTTPTESVATQSMGWMFPVSSPSCSINPSDCDGLWAAYTASSSKWESTNATASANYPVITASPSVPPCINSTQSSINEAFSQSFYGCGPCTIFGEEVQLFYFPVPTTVSRDMCATTPSATLTHYNSGVGTPYSGSGNGTWDGQGAQPETVVANNHTFTSGTAYISIKTVWAVNRCSSEIGTTVSDAILALPSGSLLSLRYSQNHFQYFATTATQTGYPFDFADLNNPIPYSAWAGQAMCEYPGAADYLCGVIYENQYNPQIAMPPGIKKLNPKWETCQMWYGGLYDPPYALKPGTAVAVPTPNFNQVDTTSAKPSSTAAATTPAPTALAVYSTDGFEASETTQTVDQNTQPDAQTTQGSGQSTQGGGQNNQGSGQSSDQDNQGSGQSTQGSNQNNGGQNNQASSQNDQGTGQSTQAGGQSNQGSTQNDQGSGQNTQAGGQSNQGSTQDNQGSGQSTQAGGQSNQGSTQDNQGSGQSTQAGGQSNQGSTQDNQGSGQNTQNSGQETQAASGDSEPQATGNNAASSGAGNGAGGSGTPTTNPHIVVFSAGDSTYTATSTGAVVVCGTDTLTPGGSAATLPGGYVVSAGTNGLVVGSGPVTVVNSASAVGVPSVSATGAVVVVSGQTQTITQDGSAGAINIGSTQLTPGGSAATLDNGQVVSAASDGIAVGGSTAKFSTFDVPPAGQAVITANGATLTASGVGNEVVVGSVTLSAGGAAQTIDNGAVVSLGSGGVVSVDGTSAAALSPAAASSGIILTVNGTPVTAYQASGSTDAATVDGAVISQGGPAATLSGGGVVSIGSSGIVVQQASSTVSYDAFTTRTSSSSKGGASSNAAHDSTSGGAEGTQASASGSALQTSAGSAVHMSSRTSIWASVLFISPLLFALYL